MGIGARDHHLGKGGHIHDADFFPHRAALVADHVEDLVAAERIVVALFHAIAGEPAGAFVAEDLFIDSALFLQQFIERRGLDWAAF